MFRSPGRYVSCDKSLCGNNGGIIAPGQSRVVKDEGVFHTECAPPAALVKVIAPRPGRASFRPLAPAASASL